VRGCQFESERFPFPDVGINLSVLEPGQPNCLYHSESQQEAFIVLAARHGAGASVQSSDPDQAYAGVEAPQRGRPPYWDRLPWARARSRP
jgi:hypothetical protein